MNRIDIIASGPAGATGNVSFDDDFGRQIKIKRISVSRGKLFSRVHVYFKNYPSDPWQTVAVIPVVVGGPGLQPVGIYDTPFSCRLLRLTFTAVESSAENIAGLVVVDV